MSRWAAVLLWLSPLADLGLPSAGARAAVSPQLEAQILETIRKHPDVILEALNDYRKRQLQQQEARAQKTAQAMRQDPRAFIGDSPVLGDRTALSVLFIFSDFQCPYCARANPILRAFSQKHPEVALVYKHLPLAAIHPEAIPAAAASWAAQQQGQFWPYHDKLLTNQDQLGDAWYRQAARELGLNPARFERDRNSEAAQAAIERDLAMAESLGLAGTPAFVLNGELFTGLVDVADLEKALR